MNKQRKESIFKIKERISTIQSELESIKDDEEYYFDNMPENLQGSIRGEDSQEAIELLEESLEYLGRSIEQLDFII